MSKERSGLCAHRNLRGCQANAQAHCWAQSRENLACYAAHVLPADMVSQLRHIPWEAQHTLSTPVQWSSSHCRAPCSKGHGRRAQDLHRTCKVDCAGANELRRLSEEDFSLALKTCAARSRVGSTTRQRSRGTHRLRMHHRIGLEKSSAASHTQWRNTLLCAHNYPSLPQ